MDAFTNYPVGVFPSSGGWQLLYAGAGNNIVMVPPGGGRALQLVGSGCWSANAFIQVPLPNEFTLEADLLISGDLSGGCDPNDACFGLCNPALGEWGTWIGAVAFQNDGQLHAWGAIASATLIPYEENTWIHVACDYDLTKWLMGVRINGGDTMAQLSILGSGAPTGICVAALHGGNPTLWTANVSLTAFVPPTFTNQPVSQVVTSGQSVTFTAGATGYPAPVYQWLFNGSPVGGAAMDSYTISNIQPPNAGSYSVVASNAVGVVTSAVAVLKVQEFPHAATATAIVVNGYVVGFTITDGGYGYTSTPTVRIIGGGGSGAEAVAVVSNGVVIAVNVLDTGSGYTNTPVVVIAPPFIAPPTMGIAAMSLLSFTNLAVGTNYQLQSDFGGSLSNIGPPFQATTTTFTQYVSGTVSPNDYRLAQEPVPAQATATPEVVNGFVVGATVTSGGSGYTATPAVSIRGESGSNATAIAWVSVGVVTNISIINPGSGYTDALITIAPPPATALSPNVTQVMELDLGGLSPYDSYQLEFAPVVNGGLSNLGTPFTPTGTTNTQFVNVTGAAGFFRVQWIGH